MIKELRIAYRSFKPYYNWIIFNTSREGVRNMHGGTVLNLIITGLSSILHQDKLLIPVLV